MYTTLSPNVISDIGDRHNRGSVGSNLSSRQKKITNLTTRGPVYFCPSQLSHSGQIRRHESFATCRRWMWKLRGRAAWQQRPGQERESAGERQRPAPSATSASRNATRKYHAPVVFSEECPSSVGGRRTRENPGFRLRRERRQQVCHSSHAMK